MIGAMYGRGGPKCFPILLILFFAISVIGVHSVLANEWWEDAVFYEVFVRSFNDSDGDGIGDLQGLIEKLDYLNDGDPTTSDDLGVTALWLMPIMPSPSYHGYDVTDYYAVESDYGTLDDLRELLEQAHARGIRVIIDLVLNHTSNDHLWFKASRGPESEYRDWYIWSDGLPGYTGPWGQRVWHFGGVGFYYGLFWSGMPDLNYRKPEVSGQVFNVVRFWLDEIGVDGFRLDAIKHLIENGEQQENTAATHFWLKGFHAISKGWNSKALLLGEVWDSPQATIPYLDNELDICFEFTLAGATLSSVNSGDPGALEIAWSEVAQLYPFQRYATFLTNHDQERVMTQLGEDFDKAKLAATVLLTSPGVPFIYYGEEIGMTGKKPDEWIRTPMQWASDPGAGFTSGWPWERVNYDYKTKNVEAQLTDSNSLLNHYRELIHLRAEYTALRIGTRTTVQSSNPKVYAYLRHSELEEILVILNFSDAAISDYRLALLQSDVPVGTYAPWDLLGDNKIAGFSVNVRGGFSDYRPLSLLEPRTGYVLLLRSDLTDGGTEN